MLLTLLSGYGSGGVVPPPTPTQADEQHGAAYGHLLVARRKQAIAQLDEAEGAEVLLLMTAVANRPRAYRITTDNG